MKEMKMSQSFTSPSDLKVKVTNSPVPRVTF